MAKKQIASLVLAAALLALSACGNAGSASEDGVENSQPGGGEPAGVAVQVQEVVSDTISAENQVSGMITTETQTSVMVAANAQVTAVYVEVGDDVAEGQTLCTLDLASTLASFNAAKINYDSAVQSYSAQAEIFETQIALYEKNVTDLQALFEIGAASQMEIDQAQLAVLTAKAQRDSTLAQLEAGMQSAIASLEQLQDVLQNVDARGNVIAPVSGTIMNLSAVENGYVSASMPVAVIDGVDQLKIVVSVSEALVPKLSVGDEVDISVSALDLSFVGQIRTLERTANMQTKLYTVSISVPDDAEGLLSGMFADVTFRTDTSADTIVIPTEAILTSNSEQYVFVVENGAARYTPVTTGLTGNGVTEVLSGLRAGEQLVIVGQAYLSDGDPVRIVAGGE